MIDEKKIEEAAQGAADLYEQDLPIMSYNEDTEVDGQHHFCQEFGAELFKDGVHWAINEFLKDLWHDVEEVPNEAKSNLLVQFKDGHFYIINTHRMLENTSWNAVNDMWNEYHKFAEARRYLYIDDLLSKKGGAG